MKKLLSILLAGTMLISTASAISAAAVENTADSTPAATLETSSITTATANEAFGTQQFCDAVNDYIIGEGLGIYYFPDSPVDTTAPGYKEDDISTYTYIYEGFTPETIKDSQVTLLKETDTLVVFAVKGLMDRTAEETIGEYVFSANNLFSDNNKCGYCVYSGNKVYSIADAVKENIIKVEELADYIPRTVKAEQEVTKATDVAEPSTTNNTETTAPTTEPATTQPATEAAPKNTYKDFSYKVNGKAVTITKYNGNSTSVSIPATIDGKPVTVIGKEAFKGNKTLQKVTISKNVATIERDAFEKCTKLNKVTFSKSVKQINRYAFAECKKLTSVTLPTNLTKLNEGVFNNTGLKSIKITKKIKAINPIALEIDSLKKITVAKNNTKFSDKAGVLYNKKQTKLLICPRKIAKKRLTVPGTVKTIDDFAFSQNKTLTKVTLPKKLKKIGMSAFANVKKLKTITIPKSVTDIDDAAFIKPIKLKGYKNSVTETYAKAYGLKFIKLG